MYFVYVDININEHLCCRFRKELTPRSDKRLTFDNHKNILQCRTRGNVVGYKICLIEQYKLSILIIKEYVAFSIIFTFSKFPRLQNKNSSIFFSKIENPYLSVAQYKLILHLVKQVCFLYVCYIVLKFVFVNSFKLFLI